MNWKDIVRDIVPLYGFAKYSVEGIHRDERKGLNSKIRNSKLSAHMAYALGATILTFFYATAIPSTGEINPIKQWGVHQRKEQLKNQLFRPYGLADANKDGVVSLIEEAEAYTKMGFWNSRGGPMLPTLRQLEEAVESYNAENQ